MAVLCVDRASRQVIHYTFSRPVVNCTDGSNPGVRPAFFLFGAVLDNRNRSLLEVEV